MISVRGGDPGDVAVELDGVPMFRASDGGTASTLSSLGQQELQAYTGGAPASADANGLSGYINQVMRTGTYPGFVDATLGVGYPTFYHKASIELGGATPNRSFTYFFATSGVNQGYRYCGQDMCGGYTSGFFYPLQVTGKSGMVYDGSSPAYFAPGATYALTTTSDRETVANLHAAIPHHHDGLRDDVQFLYVNSEIFSQFYSSINDLGGQSMVNKAIGAPTYTDYNYYTGAVFAPPDPSKTILASFPSSPTDRLPFAPIPANEREGNSNGVSVVKLQYQKNFNSNSYLRVFGYTNYSNWFISGPVSEFFNYGGQIGDFEITEHAYGAKAIYENQLSSKHLLSANLSYQKQANQTYSSNIEGIISTNLVDTKGNCYNFSTGNYASCFTPVYFPPANGCSSSSSSSSSSGCTPVLNPAGGLNEYTQYGATLPGFPSTPKLVPGNPPAGSLAAVNGARWLVTENGAWTDQYDNVAPIWSAVALTDQWHPNDRLTVNAGLRAERYDYDLGDAIAGFPARAFWFSAFNRENCYAQGQPLTTPRTIDPTTGLPSPCPAGSHPTNLQNTYPSVASYNSFLPRLGFTYLLSPDSVLRGSYGRYADAPSSSDEQVNAYQQNLALEPGRLPPRRLQHAVPQRAAGARQQRGHLVGTAPQGHRLRVQIDAVLPHDERSDREHPDRLRGRRAGPQRRLPEIRRGRVHVLEGRFQPRRAVVAVELRLHALHGPLRRRPDGNQLHRRDQLVYPALQLVHERVQDGQRGALRHVRLEQRQAAVPERKFERRNHRRQPLL